MTDLGCEGVKDKEILPKTSATRSDGPVDAQQTIVDMKFIGSGVSIQSDIDRIQIQAGPSVMKIFHQFYGYFQ